MSAQIVRAISSIPLRSTGNLLRRDIEKISQLRNFSGNTPRKLETTSLSSDAAREVAHHANFANDWWNANGVIRALHSLNEIRVPFIRDGLIARGHVDAQLINTTSVLKNQKILEVGCGGGILTEQLARLGASVTGIDLGENLINVAREHLKHESPELSDNIIYKIQPVEVHANECPEYYDAVVLSEVVEHIDDKASFLTASVQTLKVMPSIPGSFQSPGGSIFITTLNKTVPLWVAGILVGEYVLNLVPKGTHHWDKLISPIQLQRILDSLNCQTVLVNGSTYDFWKNSWRWINSTMLCYALQAIKL